jgi:hypothetical protein
MPNVGSFTTNWCAAVAKLPDSVPRLNACKQLLRPHPTGKRNGVGVAVND